VLGMMGVQAWMAKDERPGAEATGERGANDASDEGYGDGTESPAEQGGMGP
jgi:hypothetical protein